jgi:hypothetical protein
MLKVAAGVLAGLIEERRVSKYAISVPLNF